MKISKIYNPRINYILKTLSEDEYGLIAPHLELVTLSRGEALFGMNPPAEYVYFPLTFIASLLCYLEDGIAVEVALVGNDGILGISAFLGGHRGLTEVVIHKAGEGYRISAKSLQIALERSGGRRAGNLHRVLLRYTCALFTHMSQTAACARHHTTEQRLCRWLLLNFDRMSSNTLPISKKLIGYILGTRRETISQAADNLKKIGVIESARGSIKLKDKLKLEAAACECYKIIKEGSLII